jgi:hypothetical protein
MQHSQTLTSQQDKNIYENSKIQIKINNKLGRPIKITRGIKQGDPLSPKCFTSTLEKIVNKLTKSKGLKISDEFLYQLSFADDIALISNDLEKLQDLLNEVHEESEKYGLNINFEKTKILTNIKTPMKFLKIKDNHIEIVEKFKYLGQEISFNDCSDIEINNRIAAAWKSFYSLKKFFQSKIPMYFKKRLFDSCVLPTFLYGCQTWSLTNKQKEKFSIAQREMERKLLNIKISDKISNEKIRKKTKIIDVCLKMNELKWNWAGHFSRHENMKRWPRLIENYQPNGKRKRGRTKTRWVDNIKNYAGGIFWKNKAKNRKMWKEMGETFIQI